MRGLRIASIALAVGLTLGIVGTASAAAAEFTATRLAPITAEAESAQVFRTAAGEWRCDSASGEGDVTALRFSTLEVTFNYGRCSWLGFQNAIVSPVTYSIQADGTVSITKEFTFQWSTCTMRFPAQADVGTATFTELPWGELETDFQLGKLTSAGEGLCEYQAESGGAAAGFDLIGEVGGELGLVY